MDIIDVNRIKNFDYAELTELLTSEALDKYRDSIYTKEFITAVFEANYAYSLNIPLNHAVSKNEENNCISINNQKVAEAFMSKIVLELLNNMEYFAMHFTHGVADDSVVFQSLHQTYIRICRKSSTTRTL